MRPISLQNRALRLGSGLEAALAIGFAAAIATACTASSEEVRPPADELYFPTGLALSPDEGDLYVVNANSDLRFDSGVVNVINVATVVAAIEQWDEGNLLPGLEGCAADAGFPITLICTEQGFIDGSRSARIGNFATELGVQALEGESTRLFVAVRGDPSMTFIDIASPGAALQCGGGGSFGECDEDHRLTSVRDDDDLPGLPDEPFGVYVDSVNGYAITTHLSQGAVSLANAPVDGSPPILTDAVGGIFSAPQNVLPGAVGVAGRAPGTPNDRVYVTSRTDSRIQTLIVNRIPGQPAQLTSAGFFFLDTVRPSTDSRDIVFSDDGDSAYVINRDPPSLQIIDTSIDATGVPRNRVDAVVELCRQASNISIVDTPVGPRLYVACFRDGEVWGVDPEGRIVESITSVGRGPQFLAASPVHGLLFVSNFRENTIAVIDLRAGSPTQNRVVLRIGRAGETEGVE